MMLRIQRFRVQLSALALKNPVVLDPSKIMLKIGHDCPPPTMEKRCKKKTRIDEFYLSSMKVKLLKVFIIMTDYLRRIGRNGERGTSYKATKHLVGMI
jgi:hypothetical protein